MKSLLIRAWNKKKKESQVFFLVLKQKNFKKEKNAYIFRAVMIV